MQLVKLGAAVLNQLPLDWQGNRTRISTAIHAAREQGVTILCLPELCISGYGCEDAFLAPGTQRMALRVLHELLPETRGMIVSFGLPLLYQNGLFNVACLVADGKLLGFVGKKHLAGDGLHYEPRWFKPWPEDVVKEVTIGGSRHPIGDLYFDCGGVRIGFEICEDAWVANRPGTRLARQGVDVILNPSASHFAFGKLEIRKRFVLEGSRAFGVSYVYANLLGNEAGRAVYDGEAMIASAGRLIAAGPRFSFRDALVTGATVDVEATRMSQARTASYEPSLEGPAQYCVVAAFDYPATSLETSGTSSPAWERAPHIKEEEFARAIPLALFDYLRKSRAQGFVVSLSGGADSSAIVCLIHLMVELGVAELGFDGFKHKLGHIAHLAPVKTNRDLVHALLVTAYQSTANSGPVTRAAAAAIAGAVNADHLELDITTLVEGYVAMVEEGIGRKLAWQTDDIALQNIQARVRSPGIWMIANIRNALLLSTSNRSEAAVGYATMDGDTSGSVSPIAGIDKAFLRQWLVWLEKTGPTDGQSIPALRCVNEQQPTAELRPQESGQTDETDLMPYPLLDAIERAAIRDKQMPTEVFQLMRLQFPKYEIRQLAQWVERFFRLWCRNQWKRERYAPSFHVDDENLDPKTWCRFPILSGGFERELAELQAHVDSLDSTG
ncbi:MAG TPA: NAD(+) synthase [Verrucomicrobiales bacterium]|nr:NAD(+) synthase [Verrucomicrobiales bacterium]